MPSRLFAFIGGPFIFDHVQILIASASNVKMYLTLVKKQAANAALSEEFRDRRNA